MLLTYDVTQKHVLHAGQKSKASQGKQNSDPKWNKKKASKSKLHYITVTVRTTNLEVLVAKIFYITFLSLIRNWSICGPALQRCGFLGSILVCHLNSHMIIAAKLVLMNLLEVLQCKEHARYALANVLSFRLPTLSNL